MNVGGGTVDASACEKRQIQVQLVASPSLNSVAEHTVMLMLMLKKVRRRYGAPPVKRGVIVGGVEPEVTTQKSCASTGCHLGIWSRISKTMRLVGLRALDLAARSFFAASAARFCTRSRTDWLNPTNSSRSDVGHSTICTRGADCVSLHHRLTPETDGDTRVRAECVPVIFSSNTTRRPRRRDRLGLAEALETGRLAGAALDVFWYEPFLLIVPAP